MSGTAEPLFDYTFVNPTTDGDGTGWRFQAGRFGPTEPYAVGDEIIVVVAARTSQDGDPPDIRVEGITTDGSDWTRVDYFTFSDDGSNFVDTTNSPGFYAVAAFQKTWAVGDDPTGYEADFLGIPFTAGGYEETHVLMYLVHGGGPVTMTAYGTHGHSGSVGDTFVGDFHDGKTWESDYGYADTSSGSETNLYKPGAWWGRFNFTGGTVYAWVEFGSWFFALNSSFGGDHWRFLPPSSVDEGLGDGGSMVPAGSAGWDFYTITMVDVLDGARKVWAMGRRGF